MSGGFGSSTQETRRITEVERRGKDIEARTTDLETRVTALEAASAAASKVFLGSVSLAVSPATSTVKTDANVTAASVILPVASSADGWSLDAGISGITPAAGSFTISHAASTLTRSFKYVVVNPS